MQSNCTTKEENNQEVNNLHLNTTMPVDAEALSYSGTTDHFMKACVPVDHVQPADPPIDRFQKGGLDDLRRKPIRATQHRCSNTLTMVRSGGNLGIEYLSD